MARLLALVAPLASLLLDSADAQKYGGNQVPLTSFDYAEACPDYVQYSSYSQ